MTTAYELAHGRERLQTLIEFAIREGWQVRRTSDGRILFPKLDNGRYAHSIATLQIARRTPSIASA